MFLDNALCLLIFPEMSKCSCAHLNTRTATTHIMVEFNHPKHEIILFCAKIRLQNDGEVEFRLGDCGEKLAGVLEMTRLDQCVEINRF